MGLHVTSEYLADLDKWLGDVTAFVDGMRIVPREAYAVDAVLLGLLSKSINLCKAVAALVKSGFPDEAFGLCRTSIEIELTVRYITNKDVHRRARRFAFYFAKDNREWMRLINKYYPQLGIKERSDAQKLDELAKAYRSPHKWTDEPGGLRYFAEEADERETRPDGSPLTEIFYYEVLYKWMSHYVHGTVMGIEEPHIPTLGTVFSVGTTPGRFSHGTSALRTAYLGVWLNLRRIFGFFHYDIPQNVADGLDSLLAKHP